MSCIISFQSYQEIYVTLQRKRRDTKRGNLSVAFWVQKVLDFRQLLAVQALKAFMFEHGGMEDFVVLEAEMRRHQP